VNHARSTVALTALALGLGFSTLHAEDKEDPGTWTTARPGDFVEYSYKPDEGAELLGRLEVSAVDSGTVWVKLSVRDAKGAKLAYAPVAQDTVLPVERTDDEPKSAPRRWSRAKDDSKPTTIKAAGRDWTCSHTVDDQRPGDGPLREWWNATEGASLYLARGRVAWRHEPGGLRPMRNKPVGKEETTFTLTRFGRGKDAKPEKLEGVPRYFPRDAWFVTMTRSPGGPPRPTRTRYRAAAGQIVETVEGFVAKEGGELVPGSPALGKGSALASVVRDILDQPRSATAPSLGAFEGTAKPGARER